MWKSQVEQSLKQLSIKKSFFDASNNNKFTEESLQGIFKYENKLKHAKARFRLDDFF